ncbi:MAG: fructose-bisphosphate aldolase, partial [Bacteroidota bacterium]
MAKANITELLGKDAESLLTHKSKTISKEQLHLPGPDFVDRIFVNSNRSTQGLRSLQALFGTGRL